MSASDIESLVTMEDAIETQRRAFISLARNEAVLAPRVLIPGRDNSFGFLYASRTALASDLVIKAGSFVPDNAVRGLSTISAFVLVLDSITGQPKAILDGAAVTDLRTVAASAAVAQTLCPTPTTIAIIGLGLQGQVHAQVLSRVYRPTRLKVWARSATTADVEALGIDVTLATGPTDAVADADLVVLCTTSSEPVIGLHALKPTATVLSLGSVAPNRREVGPDVVTAARLIVDDLDAAVRQAGPIVHALKAGIISQDQLETIGDIMANEDVDGSPSTGLTYYNSVGVGIQDAAVGDLILARAAESGAGAIWTL